jgi:hypothetical protein
MRMHRYQDDEDAPRYLRCRGQRGRTTMLTTRTTRSHYDTYDAEDYEDAPQCRGRRGRTTIPMMPRTTRTHHDAYDAGLRLRGRTTMMLMMNHDAQDEAALRRRHTMTPRTYLQLFTPCCRVAIIILPVRYVPSLCL